MQTRRVKYNIRPNVKIKNRLNGDIVFGDLINEEEIEGKGFFVLRKDRGHVIKLSKEAYSLVKT